MTAVSEHLAYAARQIAALERSSCGLSPEQRAFEMRCLALLLDSCADAVRGLELTRAPFPSRREHEGWHRPIIARLARLIVSLRPGIAVLHRADNAA